MPRSSIVCSVALLSLFASLVALPARFVRAQSHSSAYLGLDLNDYPGDDALGALRKTFSFTGYWLNPPPDEKASSWLGKRELLQLRGFGFVVLYLGPQSRSLKSAENARTRGAGDAGETAALARKEGFPPRTIIFLDIEEGGRLPDPYHDYVNSWIDALAKAGFTPGAYCSAIPIKESGDELITTVSDLQDHLGGRKLVFWVCNDACPPSPGCVFPQDPPTLAQSGFPEAAVWQYAQSPRRKQLTAHCAATYARDGNCYAPGDSARKWLLDADVADAPNPSAPQE